MRLSLVRLSSTASGALKSALYIPGSQSSVVVRTVLPDLNSAKVFGDGEDSMEKNLHARGTSSEQLGVDLKRVAEGLERLVSTKATGAKLDEEHAVIVQKLKSEIAKSEPNQDLVANFKSDLAEIKQRRKAGNQERWTLEESVVLPFLKLPNRLHEKTPLGQEPEVDFVSDVAEPSPSSAFRSHLDHPGVVKSSVPNTNRFFVKDPTLSKLECDLGWRAQDFLQERNLADHIACPDLARSVVVEGFDPLSFGDPRSAYALKETSDFGDLISGLGTHLVGGASELGIASYLIKNAVINPQTLPITFSSNGRQYLPPSKDDVEEPSSLFNTGQMSAVGLLSVSTSAEDMMQQFEELKLALNDFYRQLNVNFRVVRIPAAQLSFSESHRIAVQMFSTSCDQYQTVASLSVYDDYVSDRLQIKYEDGNKKFRSCFLLGGTFINITRAIAAMIENGHLGTQPQK